MSKRVLLFILLFSPLFLLSQTTKEIKTANKNKEKYLSAIQVGKKNFTETVDFTENKNLIIIPVIIAGETYHFLFDTGAVAVISTLIKDRLKPKVLFKDFVEDGSGNVNTEEFLDVGDVQIGNIKFSSVIASAADFSKFDKHLCMKLDGIIGANLMRTCNWKIDYKNKKLLFSDKKIKPVGNYSKIDFRENASGVPMLITYMDKYNYFALMDTGYSGTFSISDSLFFKNSISKEIPLHKGFGKSSLTLYESSQQTQYVGLMNTLDLGGYIVKNVAIDVNSGPGLLIGNSVFKSSGEVIINYSDHKLYIANTDVSEMAMYTTFGFSPLFINGKIEVVLLWDESEAKLKGVALGDVITAINGEDTKNITQERWCELLEVFTNDDFIKINTMKDDSIERSYELKKVDILR